MHHSKLLQQLKLLDAAELKRLFQFLKSPFYNANPHIIKLYLLLRKEHPTFSSPKLTREKVFKKLFPDRKYDHQKLLNLMSDFTKLLKKYLQVLQLEKEEETQKQLLLRGYAERPGCYDIFVKQYQKTKQSLDALPHQDVSFFQHHFQLHKLYFNHPATDKFQLAKEQYDEAMDQLDRWYILEKMLLSCEMKAREKPLSEQYDIWLLPEISTKITQTPTGNPMETTYLEMLNLLEQEGATVYFKLKALFLERFPLFTRLQQQNILQSLINFTIRQGNQGQAEFLRENLELYQFGLQEQLFLERSLLNDMVYLSIVNVALRTEAIEWCLGFIDQYAAHLTASVREDAKSLATALWFYATDQPNDAIDLLLQVDFVNVYYQIQARVLLIKVYFEVFQQDDEYFNFVTSQANAFERFLQRNKRVSKNQKSALLNFTACVRKLAKWKMEKQLQEVTVSKLKTEIRELHPLYNKGWVLEQIN